VEDPFEDELPKTKDNTPSSLIKAEDPDANMLQTDQVMSAIGPAGSRKENRATEVDLQKN
jgi:hypothetical protein